MKIHSVYDAEFRPYGKILHGYDVSALTAALAQASPLPDNGTIYVSSDATLEHLPEARLLKNNIFGGMPIQLGYCNGYNTKLNCLEYHRSSEVNLGTEDFILLLGRQEEIRDGKLDTSLVKAFLCPAGTMIEVYATTLHYAPCQAAADRGFRVLVVLPRGTNTPKPTTQTVSSEDARLWAKNKWLLAHADSAEAAQGAYVGLIGANIDLAEQHQTV